MSYTADEVVSGLFGKVYDQNGNEIQGTKEFEAKLEFDKKEVKIAGKMMSGNKIVGMKGTFTLKVDFVDARFTRQIAENPFAKYNFIGELNDSMAPLGAEKILLKGVSFNGVQLTSWKTDSLSERDLDGTFDDFEYL